MKTQPSRLRSLSLALVLAAGSVSAADETPLLRDARKALAENIPQVAIHKLKTLLGVKALPVETRHTATLLLVESLLASGRHNDALLAVEPMAAEELQAAVLLKAHILADAGRWAEALPLYSKIAREPGSPTSAKIGQVEALQALGQTLRAVEILEPLVRSGGAPVALQLRLANLYIEAGHVAKARTLADAIEPRSATDRQWLRYVQGRILLADGQPDRAEPVFAALLENPEALTDNLHAAVTLAAVQARIALRGYQDADRSLETFIWRYPENPWLEVVFRHLDQIYAQQGRAEEDDLHKWAGRAPTNRAALALFYVAKLQLREDKRAKAEQSIRLFIENFPTHHLLAEVYRMQADLRLALRDYPGAIQSLESGMWHAGNEEVRAEIELRTGLVNFRIGEYLLAANLFESAARRSESLWQAATFDAALAWLNQGNEERFREKAEQLTRRFPNSELRAELLLEEGLVRARKADRRATEALQRFVREFPQHPRSSEARVALAELAFESNVESRRAPTLLRVVNERARSPEMDDQAAYLAIFLADKRSSIGEEEVIRLAREFIANRPSSPLLPDVRMKLGQIYFNREDFANAETQFATLALESPTNQYVETALFLAGQSAMKSLNTGSVDRALDYFDRVVKREEPLRLYARQQQAIIQSRLGKEREAIDLYDLILQAQPPPELKLRFAALGGKGDNLLALARRDPKEYARAVEVFDQLAMLPEVPPDWRNQALYKKGKALEAMGKTTEAIAAFYDVLEITAAAKEREFFWFYKAGFDAAQIFEQQKQWRSALGIYDKMTRFEGPRSTEAARQATKLRGELFLWDE